MAVAITQTSNPTGVDSTANITTYAAATCGTESADRIIAVCIGKEVATVAATSVTLGGESMVLANGTTFVNMGAWIYWKNFPTGTTATVAVTWDGSIFGTENHIALYAITDGAAPPEAGADGSGDIDATDPLTTGASTIATGGGMLAIAACGTDTTTKTWANLTGDINADAGLFRFQTAMSTTAGSAVRTCTGSTNSEDGALAWVIFADSVLPPLNMPPGR